MPRLGGRLVVAAVGKIKEKHWQIAQTDYVKRLSYYTEFQLVEVRDVAGRSVPEVVARQQEGERLLQAAGDVNRLIALSPEGKQMSSPALADFLQKEVVGYGRLAFLIGGPFGLAEEVLTSCHMRLSLSLLTFPHEMARIILLEQLYRACSILNGEKYHKQA
jgi:23S rRNA (pseudouridine1915-N3)-methyltransferase